MTVAYVDTSWLVAIAFEEKLGNKAKKTLSSLDFICSSNLLEAEFLAALKREKVKTDSIALLDRVNWVLPNRPMTVEFERILEISYVRGADLWHLATAMFLHQEIPELQFLSLDQNQASVAKGLGFGVVNL